LHNSPRRPPHLRRVRPSRYCRDEHGKRFSTPLNTATTITTTATIITISGGCGGGGSGLALAETDEQSAAVVSQ